MNPMLTTQAAKASPASFTAIAEVPENKPPLTVSITCGEDQVRLEGDRIEELTVSVVMVGVWNQIAVTFPEPSTPRFAVPFDPDSTIEVAVQVRFPNGRKTAPDIGVFPAVPTGIQVAVALPE